MSNAIWIPHIEEESCSGIREVSLYTKHLMNRNVFLNGEIESDMANMIVMQLMYLENTSDEPVNIYINSGGGEVQSGLMIYDTIQGMKAPINMYCTGRACSMAAIIFAGGNKGRRYILPHAKTMIHEPLISSGVGGSATSIKNISDSILETKKIINTILAKHTGKPFEEIDKATSYDNYMNAEESITFGLCDEIKTTFN